MWNRSFLILHGVENRRPAEHWQHDAAQRLREGGEQVFYPQLPEPDQPDLAAWSGTIEAELAMMRGERIVLCHSLACAAFLHVAAARTGAPIADRALLVSMPGPEAFAWDVIAGFAPAALDLATLRLAATTPRLVYADNDPYCPQEAGALYGRQLGCDVDVLPGAGHVAVADGYGPWPSALDWCLDPTTRLTVNA